MSCKNLLLLGIEHSSVWQPSIHELITNLKAELEKGTEVYTPDELNKLSDKLADYELMLQRLTEP